MNEIIIPNKKKYVSIFLLYALLISFVFIYLMLFVIDYTDVNHLLKFVLLLPIMCYVFLFTVFGVSNFIWKFNKKAILIINDEGIDDNTNLRALGKIKWDEIESIKLSTHINSGKYRFRTNMLLINLNNLNEIISLVPKWKQKQLKKLSKKFGTPYIILQIHIDYDIKELEKLILERMENYKRNRL